MQPPPVRLLRPGLLGPDPEPLGTERYERVMARGAALYPATSPAVASPWRESRFDFEPIVSRPLTLTAGSR
jgi:hypothetical protein